MLCDVDVRLLSPNQIKDLILATQGEPFEVTFTKRTTGATRTMKAKTGTYQGGKKSMQMERDGLLPVIDLGKNDWRAIPLDAVTALKLPRKEETYGAQPTDPVRPGDNDRPGHPRPDAPIAQ